MNFKPLIKDLIRIWVFGRGLFQGILLGDWIWLLIVNRFIMGWFYLSGFFLITLGAGINSILHYVEVICFGLSIKKTKHAPPIFILGGWRSGTTHLLNLLSVDQRFGYPNYVQTNNPYTFLTIENIYSKIVDKVKYINRGIDNVAMGSKVPEEDEYALLALTCKSPLLRIPFHSRASFYSRFYTFRQASASEVASWKKGLLFFVKKLTYRYSGRPIILKSPAHTGRIRMILDIFPDAKFVFIHRDPFEIFLSFKMMLQKLNTMFGLTTDPDQIVTDQTVATYKELFDAFFEEKDLIPKQNYHEVSYKNLVKNPLGEMRGIYEKLRFPEFADFEPSLKSYLSSISDYRNNDLRELPPGIEDRLANEWQRYFTEWGYPMNRNNQRENKQ